MKTLFKWRRLHVTLLEMMLVLAVLSLIAGALAYNINNAVIDQRFRTEVGRVVDELRLAQDLMLIFGTDVHVKFAKDEKQGGIKYWLELETEVPKKWKEEIHRPLKNLQAIRGVFFNDLSTGNFTKGQIDVKFLSKGSSMSQGVMRLATSSNENSPPGTLENFICLPGYPHPIFSTEKNDGDPACVKTETTIQDQQLTLSTMEKLPEKVKEPPKEEDQEKGEGSQQPTQSTAILPAPHPEVHSNLGLETPNQFPPKIPPPAPAKK